MYVTKKDLLVLAELEAFVAGSLENVGNLEDDEESKRLEKYWQDFYTRTSNLRDKAYKSFLAQQESREVRKQAKAILKARKWQSEQLLCKYCGSKKALHSKVAGLCPDRFKHFEAK